MRAVHWISLMLLLTSACLDAPVGIPDADRMDIDAGRLDEDAGLTLDAGDVIADAGEDLPDAGEEDTDAGEDIRDAGHVEPDAGHVEPDAGDLEPDAGHVEPDAGDLEPDAGHDEPDAGHLEPDAGDLEPDAGHVEPDAGHVEPDAGHLEPDAGHHEPDAGHDETDAGHVEPDAGEDLPDAGDDDPDAGHDEPDAGDDAPDAGDAGTEDGCAFDYQCESPASCVEGRCVCPIDGCEDIDECQADDLGTSGCASCLSACEASYDPVQKEREALEHLAAAFVAFREDTGGWPYLSSDWNANDIFDASTGGIDPTRFTAADIALFRQGSYASCSEGDSLERCWNGPYLTSGENLASAPWLDAWGRVRFFAIIPPVPLAGSVPDLQDGAVIVWSSGPDGSDGIGCTTGGCTWNRSATARGEPSQEGADDVVIVVGANPLSEP